MSAVDLEPGIHQLTDEEYFAPGLAAATLSSSGARTLLAPGGPARYRHQLDTGATVVKREYDLGHAVHTLVLGSGPEPVKVVGSGKDPNAWNTDKTRAEVAAARADGKVPLRPPDYVAAFAMAAAVNMHPIAGKLFTRGEPEQTLIWPDPATGVTCRAKADWLRPDGIVDLKTAESASEDALVKAVHNHGYYIQDAFYRRGFRATHPGVEPFFALVAVEKTAPHLVHVVQLAERALVHGDRKVAEALEIFRDCTAAGVWPGYPEKEITDIDLPGWVRTEEW